MREPFSIAGRQINPGTREQFEVPVARMVTQNFVHIPVAVMHGKSDGPVLFVTAAVHGDELNGTEIARQLIPRIDARRLHGTLIVIPVVNVLGFINGSRYMPDRRDLNRSFPGSKDGSLASQIAHLISSEVLARSAYGLDLHGGANHRTNLPQIRGDFTNPVLRAMADAFGAQVAIQSKQRPGSLRGAAAKRNVSTLVYEAGEPLRIEPDSVRIGLRGVMRVMQHLGMIRGVPASKHPAVIAQSSSWHRAKRSGIARLLVKCGQQVETGQPVAEIGDAFGAPTSKTAARVTGIVIGHTLNPVVHRGDALVHIAATP